MRSRMSVVVVVAALAVQSAYAQQPAEDESGYVVKTIPLRRLSNNDAATLLNPYMMHRGAAYPAGATIHAITLRGAPKTIAEMERLLAQYDRAPENVTLQFQLIAADNSDTRDPTVAGLDSVLRSVLKFTGYHRLSSALVSGSDRTISRLTMAGGGEEYLITYEIDAVQSAVGKSDGNIHIHVSLGQSAGMMTAPGSAPLEKPLLSTGLTVPDGHTVVLGSIVERTIGARGAPPPPPRALILTVTPQITAARRDDE